MQSAAPIAIRGLGHAFGDGSLRHQVLSDLSAEIRAGEIVIVNGPSGSGKTTLLTLVGGLRSVQEGSLTVLGHELRGAPSRTLMGVRRRIGYVFQTHNLIDAFSAWRNVDVSLLLGGSRSKRERRRLAVAALEKVGLGDRADSRLAELSGGERQRVAIARALVGGPQIVLADEPTASLDRRTGRGVVELMERLAREDGATVLLVTHDNRILDVADRILHLEDGKLHGFTEAVIANTRHMMKLLTESNRKGELRRLVADMPLDRFTSLLEQVTGESEEFLRVSSLSRDEAFESMLEQALDAFIFKLGRILEAERASLFLVDPERRELQLRIAQEEGGRPVDFRMPIDSGIAGHVVRTGQSLRVDDAYAHPLFNPEADRLTGFHTCNLLSVPLRDGEGQVFAVAQLLNKRDGSVFEQEDEVRFRKFVDEIGVILETWQRLGVRAREAG